jgi:hypothetical protein
VKDDENTTRPSKVFQLIEECAPLDDEWADTNSNVLPLFMVAASCEKCTLSVIY